MVKKNALLVTLVIAVLFLLGTRTLPVQTHTKETEIAVQTELPALPPAVIPKQEVSCAAPTSTVMARCREMEASILASTVRLVIKMYVPHQPSTGYEYIDGSVGHATIRNGRYLVTHNHYGLSLQDIEDGRLSRLSVYKANGEIILKDAPFGAFEVTLADPQTLVFDFGDYNGQGLFALMGMASAEFRSWEAAAELQPGMEVAQINWDGETARVEWVRVAAVLNSTGTPQLELANFVQPGTSGGGVFYNGYHVANNWLRITNKTDSGEVVRQYSIAALNSASGINLLDRMVSVATDDIHSAGSVEQWDQSDQFSTFKSEISVKPAGIIASN